MRPLAYHITWGTYGMRLHGDPRGTVDRSNTEYGAPVLGFDRERWEEMKEHLKFPPRKLTREQMLFVEHTVPTICEQGGWAHRESAAGPDHVHVVLTSRHAPEAIRRMMKRWLGQEMSSEWPLEDGATWWAEGGSIRWVGDGRYFEDVMGYVRRQRATGR